MQHSWLHRKEQKKAVSIVEDDTNNIHSCSEANRLKPNISEAKKIVLYRVSLPTFVMPLCNIHCVSKVRSLDVFL